MKKTVKQRQDAEKLKAHLEYQKSLRLKFIKLREKRAKIMKKYNQSFFQLTKTNYELFVLSVEIEDSEK